MIVALDVIMYGCVRLLECGKLTCHTVWNSYQLPPVMQRIGTQEMMCNEEDLFVVLRLMCLLSLTQGGIPKKYFDALRKEILHSYGHEYMLLLSKLQDAGGPSSNGHGHQPEWVMHSSTHMARVFGFDLSHASQGFW